MDTPICDFIRDYADKNALRLHMPGHKGTFLSGFEKHDITEITGADSLYEAQGIIKQSEQNASRLFGCPTFYSTEGSSQCIRAMLYLTMLRSGEKHPLIAAGRNAHKTFVSAAVLLDFEIDWLCTAEGSYLSCRITPEKVGDYLARTERKPAAVYLTSPDYLGNISDIRGIADVCHRYGVMLLVDNAHGAYLHYLPKSRHPIDLGADMCCDSAHKTLPVLTGGAYLHISSSAEPTITERVKSALAMFGSTSPSYLILESLDRANVHLAEHTSRLAGFIPKVDEIKRALTDHGYSLTGDEPLKLTILPKSYGYTGVELAVILEAENIVCEFADPDHLVMMFTPETGEDGLSRLYSALVSVPQKSPIDSAPPEFTLPSRKMSPREAMLSLTTTVDTDKAVGHILASVEVGCPPAVPIVVCGEEIDETAVRCLRYYGIEKCTVVSEK